MLTTQSPDDNYFDIGTALLFRKSTFAGCPSITDCLQFAPKAKRPASSFSLTMTSIFPRDAQGIQPLQPFFASGTGQQGQFNPQVQFPEHLHIDAVSVPFWRTRQFDFTPDIYRTVVQYLLQNTPDKLFEVRSCIFSNVVVG